MSDMRSILADSILADLLLLKWMLVFMLAQEIAVTVKLCAP